MRPYGATTRVLHWLTVAALGAQFAVGYLLDVDGHSRERGRGRGGESEHGHGRDRGGDDLEVFGDDALLTAHVVLGASILALALVRLLWRWRTPLPPWSERLPQGMRTVAHWTERVLYVLLLVIPATGLWLVFVDDDAVGVHVAAHVAFFVTLAVHVGYVLRYRLLPRML